MMESLQQAYNDLSKMDKIKSDFIAIASHELRTPLTHVLGYAQLLQEETEGQSYESVKRVLKSARKMQSLVEDMTNMNMLETGVQELNLEEVAVQQLVVDIYKQLFEYFKARRVQVDFDLDKQPVLVNADPEKLGRALYNSLNNAATYSPDGDTVEVCVKKDGAYAHISIKDNGRGIPKDELETIFARFYQVSDHMTRSTGGLGLGLPIARAMVELHGGRMWAESDGPDKGTKILITLPLT